MNPLAFGLLIFEVLFCVLTPIIGSIVYSKKTNTRYRVALFGAAAFFIAVMILESALHQVVLVFDTPISKYVTSHVAAFVIYGTLAAGIFEETARFIVMKFIIKEEPKYQVGVLYGIGHGGIEMFLVAGANLIATLVIAFMVQTGTISVIYSSLAGDSLAQMKALVTSVTSLTSIGCLMGILERVSALVLHIGLSLIVYYGVVQKKYYCYPIAIVLHALADTAPALYQAGTEITIYTVEVIVFFVAAIVMCVGVYLAERLNRGNGPATILSEEEE